MMKNVHNETKNKQKKKRAWRIILIDVYPVMSKNGKIINEKIVRREFSSIPKNFKKLLLNPPRYFFFKQKSSLLDLFLF